MMILIGKNKRKIKIINNIDMKQKEYCRPETEFLAVASENVLCTSDYKGSGNEGFGDNEGKLPEVDW